MNTHSDRVDLVFNSVKFICLDIRKILTGVVTALARDRKKKSLFSYHGHPFDLVNLVSGQVRRGA